MKNNLPKRVRLAEEELSECKTKCKCGHVVVMTAMLNECICSHCKNKVKNTSKARFKYLLFNERNKENGDSINDSISI